MQWRVARGLETLLAQINAIAPDRSKASDGSIGDPAHQTRPSDHNPDSQGVVRARDFTHDPGHGADMHELAEALRLSRDRRISYVIFNRRVFSATNAPWTWRPYAGDNPHDHHMHVSVVSTSVADDTTPWEIAMPLTSDDIRRVSDATAAKVLGKAWSIPGRTLAGSVEALINLVRAGAKASDIAELAAEVAALRAVIEQLQGGSADTAAILAGVDERLAAFRQVVRADVDEQLDQQSRAGADAD